VRKERESKGVENGEQWEVRGGSEREGDVLDLLTFWIRPSLKGQENQTKA
jgi:hypothetical protein